MNFSAARFVFSGVWKVLWLTFSHFGPLHTMDTASYSGCPHPANPGHHVPPRGPEAAGR